MVKAYLKTIKKDTMKERTKSESHQINNTTYPTTPTFTPFVAFRFAAMLA